MHARSIRSRHFHVPARELLLQVPQRCPYLPGLVMVGIAVTDDEQHHVILELGSLEAADRFYLGPTQGQARRRAGILAQALRRPLGAFHAGLVQSWVCQTWESLVDVLVDELTAAEPGL